MTVKKFFPVIHVLNLKQMMTNLEKARQNGADGAFLINHGPLSPGDLFELHAEAVEAFPEFWIGINCLGLFGREVFSQVDPSVDGVWVDDGGVCDESSSTAKLIYKSKKRSGFRGMYFGGVAFKTQGRTGNLKRVSKEATKYMDVVTTSGPCTGRSAPIEKIRTIKEAIGDKPLALASGVTAANVRDYLPYVDYFLAATGISHSFNELDSLKVRELARIIHGYE